MCMLNSLPLIMTAVLLVCIPFEAWAFGIFVNIFIIGYNSSAKIELALVMDWSGVYGPRLCSSFLVPLSRTFSLSSSKLEPVMKPSNLMRKTETRLQRLGAWEHLYSEGEIVHESSAA